MTSHRHRKAVLAALLAAFSGAFVIAQTHTPAPSPDPVELVKQGRKLNGEGKQDEAIALYRQALVAKPDLYDAHLAMGIALDLKADYAQARQHLDRAIAVAPAASKAQALRTMAMSYAFEGKAADAAKYEQQVFDTRLAASDFTGAAEIANELARVYLESGDVTNARKWYETGHQTALRKSDLKPAEKDLWDFRWEHAQARIAARQGQHDAAQKHVAAAKALLDKGTNPEQTPYFPYLAGYVAFYAKDFRTAAGEFAKANQEDPFILAMLAQAHEGLGDSAKAKDLYRQVLASNGHNPNNAFARPLATKKISGKTP
jgi:tetratricopeptide (TPR) repeat protein